MSSERRIRASRANGAKSRGPKTPESMARSARSNLKHGLLSTIIVLKDENLKNFADLLAAFERDLQPQNEIELAFVENMAAGRWRLLRLWAIERSTLQVEMENYDPSIQDPATRASRAFRALADNSRALDLLNRYESRFDRQFARSLTLLREIQRDRPDLPPASEPVVPEKPFLPTDLVPETDTNAQ